MRRRRIEKALFAVYVVWMTVGFVLTALHIAAGPWADLVLMLLAAVVVYFSLAARWGDRPTGRWLALVLPASAAAEACGASTGFPFGPYGYTGAFGPRLGPLPLAIPLAWFVVAGSGAAFFDRAPRLLRALYAALLAVAFDALMEPFAVELKGYWSWRTPDGLPPGRNYAAWGALAFLLVLAAPQSKGRGIRNFRPTVVLGSMALLFVFARVFYEM